MNKVKIGPFTEGLRKDLKPAFIPDDSFEVLENAYQFRGRIIRKAGYSLLGRLSPDGGITFPGNPVMGLRIRENFAINLQETIAFDTTSAYRFNGTAYITLPSVMPVTWSGTDYQFFNTINYANAFWATNSKPGLNGISIFSISNTNPAVVTTTVNHGFTTGQQVAFININGFTPSMNGEVHDIIVLGPNTFSIPVDGTTKSPYISNGMALNSQVTIAGQDGIRYYAGTSIGTTWVNYNPPIDPNNALAGCLLMVAYRGYLVFLNTWEGNEQSGPLNYFNRARWTQIGTPYYSEPVPNAPNPQGKDPFAARDDLFGRGGANDAPTNETIVGCGFIRDILIVFFERSTWRLRFVNNSQNPFVWERVNIEFGSDSPFSTVNFDKGLMAIGDRGIVISDGNDTIRIDDKIPDDIFNIRQSDDGFRRIYGLRTFEKKLIYWTYPSSDNPTWKFSEKILVYNYETKNWSYFDDSFTCFGYFFPQSTAQTWADMTDPWSDYHITWDSGIDSFDYETPVAGNQQGFVFLLEQTGNGNDPSLAISAIGAGGVITSANHNLKDGTWIKLTGITGTTDSDGISLNNRNYKVSNPTNSTSQFTLTEFEPIQAGNAIGATFLYNIDYLPIIPGSVQINVGAFEFKDTDVNGILYSLGVASGTIDYLTGALSLSFNPPLGISTPVIIRVVSYDTEQMIVVLNVTGAYTGGGLIAKISNFDIQTKIFNFFEQDNRTRLSKIDFYVDATQYGELTCNVFSDSDDTIINQPISDNLQSNVIKTTYNPYQFGQGEETIYRLYCDAIAQTIQLQLTMSDRQMAVDVINQSNFQLLSMIFNVRKGGRLV